MSFAESLVSKLPDDSWLACELYSRQVVKQKFDSTDLTSVKKDTKKVSFFTGAESEILIVTKKGLFYLILGLKRLKNDKKMHKNA